MRPLLAAVLVLLTLPAWAGLNILPTTTLSAETSNNTSAAATFTTQTNGNAAPANISKAPMRSLLYAGSNTAMYAHFMAWFGGTNHMNVGYRSDDTTQVNKQITDMLSRGIQGMIIDWYGPNRREDTASLYVKADAETRGGQFVFSIMEDGGALKSCANTVGCSVTQKLISDLAYVYSTYEGSPAYMRMSGRPVVGFFGTEAYTIDWNAVRAAVSGNPLFIFRNSGAFTKTQTNGGYSWTGINTSNPNDMGLGYLDNFYNVALNYPAEYAFGSAYKGFNDTLASWSANRVVNQQCAQTWLATMKEESKYFNANNQLDAFQLVTWNDYEEGTELETGIDNCASVSGSSSGSNLNWALSGQENTVDHYTVFISTDGQNLMPLRDVAAGTHTLNLGSFAIAPATYSMYVKAVGKPSIRNHMSPAITYRVSPQVKIGTPLNNSTVTTKVAVKASAYSPNPVTAMQIYLDNKLIYQQKPAILSTTIKISVGTHYMVVKGWDTSGASFSSAVSVKASVAKTTAWRYGKW